MTTYEECSFSWYVCSTPMAAWKHNVHTGSESVPRRASVGQFGVSEQDVRLPRQRPTFGFSAPACLSFLFIFFSLFFSFFFTFFATPRWMQGICTSLLGVSFWRKRMCASSWSGDWRMTRNRGDLRREKKDSLNRPTKRMRWRESIIKATKSKRIRFTDDLQNMSFQRIAVEEQGL